MLNTFANSECKIRFGRNGRAQEQRYRCLGAKDRRLCTSQHVQNRSTGILAPRTGAFAPPSMCKTEAQALWLLRTGAFAPVWQSFTPKTRFLFYIRWRIDFLTLFLDFIFLLTLSTTWRPMVSSFPLISHHSIKNKVNCSSFKHLYYIYSLDMHVIGSKICLTDVWI